MGCGYSIADETGKSNRDAEKTPLPKPPCIDSLAQPAENGRMQPSRELIDAIFRQRVLRARQMSPEEKLLAGPRLFDKICQIMMADIRHQFPDADEQQVFEIAQERLESMKRMEEGS
jgi:hypothetical protein